MENLVMEIMRYTIANHQQEIEEELFEYLVAFDVFLFDVWEYEDEEIQHLQRRRPLLTYLHNFLQIRKYDFY